MRKLTYALVAISMLLSTGGVALRSSADSHASSTAAAEATVSKGQESPTCSVRPPPRVRTLKLAPRTDQDWATQLNSRGYNYTSNSTVPAFDPPTPEPASTPASAAE